VIDVTQWAQELWLEEVAGCLCSSQGKNDNFKRALANSKPALIY
jgi:hypothetical protein